MPTLPLRAAKRIASTGGKKKHNLIKVEKYGLLSEPALDLSPEDSLSVALRDCSEEAREKPGCKEIFATKQKPNKQTNKQKPQVVGTSKEYYFFC